ncbi:MAG: adenylate/guanylate cyclase domain-containing protein [Solirubrobacterales bacterium]
MAVLACISCGTENPAEARFCMSCGGALERRCPSCGEPAPAEARFCMSCGGSLEDGSQKRARQREADREHPEERRQVTVVFADLSGYTAVAERMDPESVKALVDRSLKRLGEEVERFGGTVDKYIGDNVMALFGAPIAHEDDAERAVRAGLGMQDAMSEINEQFGAAQNVSLALRVGVNTGEVVAGAVGDGYTVIGDTVNVAARLQSAARPGSVTVGERTYLATDQAIEYEALEPLTLKGKTEPVAAWEAVKPIATQPTRRVSQGESPLIGRTDKLELLGSLYERVERDSSAQLVTMFGQAGVGKSRLRLEFARQLSRREPQPTFREGRCLPYGSGVVYWALGEILRAEAGIVDDDSAEVAWEKLSGCMAALTAECGVEASEPSERRAAVIARLLGIDIPSDVPQVEVEDPQRMRETFFSAVRSCIEAIARRKPLVLVFEDIHWADHGMLDLIEYLAQWVRAPLLILCLARDDLLERRAGWGGGRLDATSIVLEPLSDDETRELIASLLGEGKGSDAVGAVAERAGGNPFFVEEMVRTLAEREGDGAVELPDTVQGLLAARLDSLEPFERRLVQHASVVGRTFWEGSLSEVASQEGADLGRGLTALQEKDIVVPDAGSRLAGEREFAFKHVLIRDVAYGMLPRAVRSHKHYEVGRFIEERVGDRSDEVVSLLAEHYGRSAKLGCEAGLPDEEMEDIHAKALRFLESAGDAAGALFSNPEAYAHYQAARDVRCPHDPAAMARIMDKQGDVAFRMGRVAAAIEVWEECLEHHRQQEDLTRVADLQRKIGAGLWHMGERKQAIERYQKGINLLKDGPPCLELVRLYEEAASLYMHAGDNMLAIYASEKALRLAERLNETRVASRAHGIFGRVFGRIGDTEKARENLERSVELARDSDEGETIRALLTLGHHLEVSEADYKGAGDAYVEGLRLAEQIGDLPSQVELHSALAQLASYRADWEQVKISTDASVSLAEREGLVGKLCYPYVLRGVLAWREGKWDAAEQHCRRAHELAEQVGWSEVSFSALFWLGRTLRDSGDHATAVVELDRALDVCERAGLIAQSIEAMVARAITLALGDKLEQGREAADEASRLSGRLHYPVGHAAALEALAATAADPEEGRQRMGEARALWEKLGRPLDVAICDLLLAHVLKDSDGQAAHEALALAGTEFEALGVAHLAQIAQQYVDSDVAAE